MKANHRLTLNLALLAMVVSAASARAKPPPPAKEERKASPSPVTSDGSSAPSLLRWLLLQNGGPDAASVGWPELVRATTGTQVFALDPANAAEATTVLKLGASLDALLPRLNRPDGAWRAATTAGLACFIGEELRTSLVGVPGTNVENLADPTQPGPPYPGLRWVDAASGRTFYLGVALYPTGERAGTLRALRLEPAEAARRIKADGCCLLAAIEHNGKSGRELAFLNWELIDLAKISLRCAVTFEADQNALHAAGATVTDGRKGRD